MVDPAEMAERHACVLAELSELGMGFARLAMQDAEAAQTPEARAQAALVFQRVSRSIRQSLALEAKLVRDGRREDQAHAREEAQRRKSQTVYRRLQLREAVDRLVWHETENMDAEEEDSFDDQINAAVDDERDSETFLTDPLSEQVARVIGRLGFEITAAGHARRIPEPGPHPAPQPAAQPEWQGSG